MPKKRNPEKATEMKKVISKLFAQNGYRSTSMREIARHMGMNQASLYYYFKNKEDMLFKLMNDSMDEALTTLEDICASDLSPVDKLNEVLSVYTRFYAGDQDRLVLLVNEIDSLGEDHREMLRQKERRYLHLIRSILQELTDQHKMKPVDSGVAAFAFFGMVHYTIKWYNAQGSIGVDKLSEIFLEIFTRGIMT
jgi:AcrR family transcriptional regulator